MLFDLPAPEIDVRGYSFLHPWGEAIVRPVPHSAIVATRKNIDNRPPRSALGSREGRYIAIHTSQGTHKEGLAWLNKTLHYRWSENDLSPSGVILGVARVVGRVATPSSPWHFGAVNPFNGKPNVGWMLDDVVLFDVPVRGTGGGPIPGRLGCWYLPVGVLHEVRALYKSAKGLR